MCPLYEQKYAQLVKQQTFPQIEAYKRDILNIGGNMLANLYSMALQIPFEEPSTVNLVVYKCAND